MCLQISNTVPELSCPVLLSSECNLHTRMTALTVCKWVYNICSARVQLLEYTLLNSSVALVGYW